MQEQERPARSRRRRVTRESLVEAGIELSLSKLTVKALAEHHGVSIVAIYNNIVDVHALKAAVSEEILARWDIPMPAEGDSLERSLTILSDSLRDLVHDNPGIAAYLADLDKGSAVLVRINEVQRRYSTLYGLTPKQTSWAVVTVVEHSISLAELVHVAGGRARTKRTPPKKGSDLDFIAEAYDENKRHTEDEYWAWSMRAVIVGATTLIHDPQFDDV